MTEEKKIRDQDISSFYDVESWDEFAELSELSSDLNKIREEVQNANLSIFAVQLSKVVEILKVDPWQGMRQLDRLSSFVINAADRDPSIYLPARLLLSIRIKLQKRLSEMRG